MKDEEEDSSVDFENKLQVLMVSSPNRHDLVFPKVFLSLIVDFDAFVIICKYNCINPYLCYCSGRMGR